MLQRAGIQPYLTNHSLMAIAVTVLSSEKMETQQIKAVTGHKSEASIQSYCERPTLNQFHHMSSALTSFIDMKENTPPRVASSSSASALCLVFTLHDWLKRFPPLFHPIRSETKTNCVIACRALRQLHVITSSFDWFTVLSVFFVIG